MEENRHAFEGYAETIDPGLSTDINQMSSKYPEKNPQIGFDLTNGQTAYAEYDKIPWQEYFENRETIEANQLVLLKMIYDVETADDETADKLIDQYASDVDSLAVGIGIGDVYYNLRDDISKREMFILKAIDVNRCLMKLVLRAELHVMQQVALTNLQNVSGLDEAMQRIYAATNSEEVSNPFDESTKEENEDE